MAGGTSSPWRYRIKLTTGTMMILMMMILSFDIFSLAEGKVINRYTEASGSFRTMVYDRRRQRLYIGDTNSLHALSTKDFSRVGSLLLGPMDDSLDCPFDTRESCPPGASRESTDNINQLLIYDEDDDVLIACGTLFYGSCERINLDTFITDPNLPHRPTVPNDPDSSVVAFYVSSQRVTYDFGVLYVGASYSFKGTAASQSNIHMLSSRQASTLNYLPGAASFIDVLSNYRSTFLVEFVAAFEHEGFAYFLITRKENFSTSQRRTFLLRFCLNDAALRSLVELRLECAVSGSIYGRLRAGYKALVGKKLMSDALGDTQTTSSWALYGLFTVDQDDNPTPKGASAICVFPMKQIEEAVQKVTASCFSGNGLKGPSYIVSGTNACTRKDVQIPSDYCGVYDMNYPLFDAKPLTPTYSIALPGVTGLSLRSSIANDHTIATVGTVDGRIVQLVLRSRTNSQPAVYRETGLDMSAGSALTSVKQLMFGMRDSDTLYSHFYARTDNVVYQVAMFDCESMKSCNACIVDPHCGWCASSNKCTRKSLCNQASFWLNDRCPIITSLDPTLVPRGAFSSTKFTVILSFVPADRKYVWCALEYNKAAGSLEKILAKSEASIAPGLDGQTTYSCGPFKNIPADTGVVVNTTLKMIVDDSEWATGTISVYNCARISQCSDCAVSVHPCKWCIERHACLRSTMNCDLPNGNPGTVITDAGNCPSIDVRDNRTLLVADGTTLNGFSIVAYNMMEYFRDTLQCKFKTAGDGKIQLSKAKYTSSSTGVVKQIDVTCDPIALTYAGTAPYDAAELDLVWGNDQALDKPKNLSVRVYKCRYLVNSCGQCLTLAEGYECGWCRRDRGGGESFCAPSGECTSGGVWMGRQEVCSDPKITSIQPLGGPVVGGTMLTINGVNLGKVSTDLEISVAEKPCIVQSKGYIPSQRVVCSTTGSGREVRGPVLVTTNSRYSTPVTDSAMYYFKDPSIGMGTLKPKSGPVSGGTLVTIQGKNLDYGSVFNVLVNGLSCSVVKRTSDMVAFTTPRFSLTGEVSITFNIDGMGEFPLNDRFRYVADPTVTRTEPMFSLFSGGTNVTVIGTGLDSVQQPQMIVHYPTGNKTTPCRIKSATQLECPTANLSGVGLSPALKVDLPVGWIMDNVTSLVYIKVGNWVRTLTYNPDPEVYLLSKPFPYTEKQQMLEIKGNNMELLKAFKDLEVLVGGAQCWIDQRDAMDVIRCRMPEPDDPKELNRDGLARIVVTVGNYRREIGYVRYSKGGPNVPLILGLVFGLLLPLLICAGIVAFCYLRRRKLKSRSAGRKRGLPSQLEMNSTRGAASRSSNSYTEAAGNQTGTATPQRGGVPEESVPLRRAEEEYKDDEGIAKDDEAYFRELLKRISNPKVRSAAKEVFIHRERLEIGNLLGKGHFGRVYAATLRDELLKNPQQVAVKTIEDSEPNHKLMENFLQEGIVMKNFNHPHVLGLIGMCLGYKKEPMVILPFMANGDLRTYVKDKRKSFTARQLLLLAQQVAEGMAYLSSLNYIHRDLAARNCMIDDKNVVKVADFGLSHQLYDKEYYSSKDPKSKLPIKWMALESLEEFVFTIKSDVWSFGVLMWELMTRGVTPYPDVEVFETRNYLASGRRLRKPKYCPDNVYSIMTDCWQGVSENRPSFSELVNRLEFLLNPPKPGQVGSTQGGGGGTEPMYINMAEPSDNQDYLKPINPDSSFAPTDSSFYPEPLDTSSKA